MKKKIFLLLIFLFSFMGFSLDVRAEDYSDRSLFYSIEKFAVDKANNKIVMEGWAFIHNVNQCGNGECKSESYTSSGKQWTRIKNWKDTVKYYYRSDVPVEKSKIYFELRDKSNNVIFSSDCQASGCKSGAIVLEYKPVDLFTWMCTLDGNKNCNGYVIDNVGFKVSIDLSNIDYNREYSIYIGVKTNTLDKSVVLGVDSLVYSGGKEENLNNGAVLKVDNIENYVVNHNNPGTGALMSSNDNGKTFRSEYKKGWYFKQNEKYQVISKTNDEYSTDGDKRHDYFPIMYKLRTSYGAWATSGCVNNNYCGSSEIYYWGPATWFTAGGGNGVKLKVSFNNIVCSSTDKMDNTVRDCNGTAKATCDKMTVFNSNKNSLGEVNNLSEEISFSMDDNYSSMKIYAGGGFPFGMTFTDTISWENDKTVKNAAALKQTIMNTYFVGGRGYLNEIKSKLQNGFNSMKQGDELKLSDADVGSWSCSNEENYINKIVTKCTYRVNTAYLYYVNSGKISYTQSENSINGGNKFYVALSYGLEQYRWQMKTGNLSILKIRTSKDSYVPNVTFNFKIDTPDIRSVLPDSNGNGKACYINVYQDFYHTGDGDGTDDGDTLINTNEVKFSYRTVNISYPFPNNVKADNWSDYCDNHNCSAVFKESYNDGNLEYKTKPLTGSVLTSINGLDNTLYGYKGFNSIDIYGSNSFISDRYFETRNGRHCYIGKLVDWTGKKGCAE